MTSIDQYHSDDVKHMLASAKSPISMCCITFVQQPHFLGMTGKEIGIRRLEGLIQGGLYKIRDLGGLKGKLCNFWGVGAYSERLSITFLSVGRNPSNLEQFYKTQEHALPGFSTCKPYVKMLQLIFQLFLNLWISSSGLLEWKWLCGNMFFNLECTNV